MLGRRWHATQEISKSPEGLLRLTMRLNNIEEVEKWVMGFGTHATVVRPNALRERLAKTGEEWATRYGAAEGRSQRSERQKRRKLRAENQASEGRTKQHQDTKP